MNCAEPDGAPAGFAASVDFAAGSGVLAGLCDIPLLCAKAEPIMRALTAVVIISFFNMWILLERI
jgi:hypothetical protein